MNSPHVTGVFGYWLLTIIPAYFIARKAGFSPWWCLMALTPPTAIISLWLVAFVAWPAGRSSTEV